MGGHFTDLKYNFLYSPVWHLDSENSLEQNIYGQIQSMFCCKQHHNHVMQYYNVW